MPTLVSIDADSLKALPPSGAKRTVIVWLCPVPKLKLFPTVIRNGETEATASQRAATAIRHRESKIFACANLYRAKI